MNGFRCFHGVSNGRAQQTSSVVKVYHYIPELFGTVLFIFFFVLAGLLCSCVIPSGPMPVNLTMTIAGGDTISPFGKIVITFSEPLNDSLLWMRIVPGVDRYVVMMNPARTEGTISITTPFYGNARHVLFSDQVISSKNGGKLDSGDSVAFMTIFREIEPNDSPDNADSIRTRICGVIETVDDSDWYAVPKYPVQRVYLQEFGSNSIMNIVDSSGKIISGSMLIPKDTLVIPDSLNIPLFVVVTSYMRSAGGYYEIGIQGK